LLRTPHLKKVAAILKDPEASDNDRYDVHEYPELGMEAIWKIEVEDFQAFILVDDKGNDFFRQICA
jgi:tartrate dehydratase beta subunit/fumarate hydratase class I family protein